MCKHVNHHEDMPRCYGKGKNIREFDLFQPTIQWGARYKVKTRNVKGNAITGCPLHRENKENGRRKFPLMENREIGNFVQTHGNMVCSSCKFSDSIGKIYFHIFHKKFLFFYKLDKSAKSVLCM